MDYLTAIKILTESLQKATDEVKESKENEALRVVLATIPVREAELQAYKRRYREISEALLRARQKISRIKAKYSRKAKSKQIQLSKKVA